MDTKNNYRPITFDIDIPDGNPFENDKLEREEFAQTLTYLINSRKKTNGLVISLEAGWGEGKTTFLHMWEKYLFKQGLNVIYIDAFAHDFIEDPFVLIAGEIMESTVLQKESPNIIGEFSQKAKNLLSLFKKVDYSSLAFTLIENIIKNKTGVDIEKLSSMLKEYSLEENNIIKDNFEKYNNAKTLITEFKEKLQNLAKEKTLVIIIDELDRCKPDFAVSLIEKIKHFFSAENVVFLLSVNGEHLEASLKHIYGDGIDAQTYWQKFIHFGLGLPKNSNIETGDSDYLTYMKKITSLLGLSHWHSFNDTLQTFTLLLLSHLNLSLRDLEKIAIYFSLFHFSPKYNHTSKSNPHLNQFRPSALNPSIKIDMHVLYLITIILKIKNPKRFSSISQGNFKLAEIKKTLDLDNFQPGKYSININLFIEHLKECTLTKAEFKAAESMNNEFGSYSEYLEQHSLMPFAKALNELS